MKVLLHVCCAICACGVVEELRTHGHQPVGFFYNPNIHPFIEFRRRLKAARILAARLSWDLRFVDRYGLYDYLNTVDYASTDRCLQCYRMRLAATARHAKEGSYEAFTTTLLASSHQQIADIERVGAEVAEEAGVAFLRGSWSNLERDAAQSPRSAGLYKQQYCGCIFSEYDRYKDTTVHTYKET